MGIYAHYSLCISELLLIVGNSDDLGRPEDTGIAQGPAGMTPSYGYRSQIGRFGRFCLGNRLGHTF